MKSFASLDIWSNASSSKSHIAAVTFDSVSESISPENGERPDKLKKIQNRKSSSNARGDCRQHVDRQLIHNSNLFILKIVNSKFESRFW